MNKFNFFLLVIMLPAIIVSCNTSTEDPNEDLKRDMKIIDAYLTAQGVPASQILYDNNTGVRFVFDEYGQGITPVAGQNVRYSVIGSVLSGGTTGLPFILNTETKKVEDVSPQGLNYGLRSVLQGSRFVMYVPARFGYGTAGNATLGIPGDAVLRYDLELEQVGRTIAQQTKFQEDTTAIENYIIEKEIPDAIEHPSGIRYTMDIQGTGATPTPYSFVTFEYKLKTMANPGTVIETNTLTNHFVFGLIDGMKIGLQTMKVGSTHTFYIPSGMGYGPSGTGSIPANANLIFEIKLTAIGD